MHAVIESVLPVFALILVGYGFGRSRFLSAEGSRGLGIFVYYLAIPALLFRGMADPAAAPHVGSLAVLGAYFAATLLVFAATMALGRGMFRLGLAEQGLMAVSATFSNSVQLGIPLILAAFGAQGLVTLILIISIHSLTLLSLTTLVVELGLAEREGDDPRGFLRKLRATSLAIITNPVILAIIAGFLWRLARLPVEGAPARFIDFLAAAATPAALFALGATIAGFRIAGDFRESVAVVAIKLVILPILVWLFATRLFHLDARDTAVATLCAALPTGANAFIMAQRYDRYVARAATSVLLSTALSLLSLSALLAWIGRAAP